MAMPWLGAVPAFTLKSGDQFRAKAPPPLSSKRYAEDYNEVKAVGVRFNSARTQEQTETVEPVQAADEEKETTDG